MRYPKTSKGRNARTMVRDLWCSKCGRITEHKCWDYTQYNLSVATFIVFKAVCQGKGPSLRPGSCCNYRTEVTLEECDWEALLNNQRWTTWMTIGDSLDSESVSALPLPSAQVCGSSGSRLNIHTSNWKSGGGYETEKAMVSLQVGLHPAWQGAGSNPQRQNGSVVWLL